MPRDKPWALIVVYSGPANELPPPTLYEELVPAVNLHNGFTAPDFRDMDAICEPVYPRAHLQRLTPHASA